MWGWMKTSSETDDRVTAKSESGSGSNYSKVVENKIPTNKTIP